MGYNPNNVNGATGLKWVTLLPLVTLLGAGLITWGETRMTVANQSIQLAQVDEAHREKIRKLESQQDETDRKLDKVITQQAVTNKELDQIHDNMKQQNDKLDTIIRKLYDGGNYGGR